MNLEAPREQQIAWAAGLFEGEGCISWSGGSFALHLKNTDESIVLRFADILELGRVYGPYEWHGRDGCKRKPYWGVVGEERNRYGGPRPARPLVEPATPGPGV